MDHAGLDLCDGTLIVHAGNILECTDDGCDDHEPARHGFVVDCYDLAGGCACEATLRRAS